MKRRKILTPAFHFSILKDFIEIFNEKADKFLETIAHEGPKEIDVVPVVQEFAFFAIKGNMIYKSFHKVVFPSISK